MHLDRSSLCRTTFRTTSLVGAAAVALAGVLLTPGTAHADRVVVYTEPPPPPPRRYYDPYYDEPSYAFQLGLDLEGVAPLNPPNGPNGQTAVGGGAGIKVRLGEQLRFPGLRFTPEVGYGYDHIWAADDLGDSYDWDMHRFFAGARLGFGHLLVPTIYAHLGYGWRDTDAAYATGQNGGLAFDVGGALDLHLSRHLSFGAHLEYSQVALPTDTPQWLAVGGHLDLTF